MPPPSELLQGMLDPLILKSLAVHRMGISRPIAQVANKTFEVNPGSSFPALHGMAGLPASGVDRRPPSRQILSSDRDRQRGNSNPNREDGTGRPCQNSNVGSDWNTRRIARSLSLAKLIADLPCGITPVDISHRHGCRSCWRAWA